MLPFLRAEGQGDSTMDEDRGPSLTMKRIADALERIADNGDKIADILDDIGMHNYTPAGPPGALEMIGIELKEIREFIQRDSLS